MGVITPELKLAALLSRPKLSKAQVDTANILISKVTLSKFHNLIEPHRIWPCVYCNLRDYFPDLLSEASFSYLMKRYQQNTRQSQRSFDTCGKLLKGFKDLNLEVKVLKGLPLAFKLYGDISKRHSKDIDLIIKKVDLEAAHTVLTRFGFQCSQFEQLTERQKSFYYNSHKDITYYDKASTEIELHVRLDNQKTKLSDQYLQQLFMENSISDNNTIELIYLCWHGSYTLFHRLKWLVDITLYIEQKIQPCNEDLVNVAGRLGAIRPLTVSWVLCNKVFGTEIPPEISAFYQQDFASRILVSRCLKQLNNPKTIIPLHFKLENFICRTLLYQYKTEQINSILQGFKPTVLDFETFPGMPSRLFFLYFLLRPFLFIYRRIVNAKPIKALTKKRIP